MYTIQLVAPGSIELPIISLYRDYTERVNTGVAAGFNFNYEKTIIRYNSLINYKANNEQPNQEFPYLTKKKIKELSIESMIEYSASDTFNSALTIQTLTQRLWVRTMELFKYSTIRLIKNKEIVFENTIQSFIKKDNVFVGPTASTVVPQSTLSELGTIYKQLENPIQIDQNDELKCEILIRTHDFKNWSTANAGSYITIYDSYLTRFALKMETE